MNGNVNSWNSSVGTGDVSLTNRVVDMRGSNLTGVYLGLVSLLDSLNVSTSSCVSSAKKHIQMLIFILSKPWLHRLERMELCPNPGRMDK